MKLDEFVERAILDIANGVLKAQQESPYWIAPGRMMGKLQLEPQFIEFDVVVTVNMEGGGGLSIKNVINAETSVSKESINRVVFKVPIHFNAPTDKHPNPPDINYSNKSRR